MNDCTAMLINTKEVVSCSADIGVSPHHILVIMSPLAVSEPIWTTIGMALLACNKHINMFLK